MVHISDHDNLEAARVSETLSQTVFFNCGLTRIIKFGLGFESLAAKFLVLSHGGDTGGRRGPGRQATGSKLTGLGSVRVGLGH